MGGFSLANFEAQISSPRTKNCQRNVPLTRYLSPHFLLNEFFSYMDEMAKEMNIHWNGDHLAEDVRIAGFENVTEKKIRIRVGNWANGTAHSFTDPFFFFFLVLFC